MCAYAAAARLKIRAAVNPFLRSVVAQLAVLRM
jgi:hypothetical protein